MRILDFSGSACKSRPDGGNWPHWRGRAAGSYNGEERPIFIRGDSPVTSETARPSTLDQLRDTGWASKTIKHELRDNFLAMLARGDELFPGIVGYESTVIPEINLAIIAGHDMLFLGEKGQAKSRLMRSLVRFLDEEIPYLDILGSPVHEDPYRPITTTGKRLVESLPDSEVPVAWWPRKQ